MPGGRDCQGDGPVTGTVLLTCQGDGPCVRRTGRVTADQHSWAASVTDTTGSRSSNEATGTKTDSTDAVGAASRAMDGE
jgi:hypothetical protein